jgi:hypothetical protein
VPWACMHIHTQHACTRGTGCVGGRAKVSPRPGTSVCLGGRALYSVWDGVGVSFGADRCAGKWVGRGPQRTGVDEGEEGQVLEGVGCQVGTGQLSRHCGTSWGKTRTRIAPRGGAVTLRSV